MGPPNSIENDWMSTKILQNEASGNNSGPNWIWNIKNHILPENIIKWKVEITLLVFSKIKNKSDLHCDS